MRISDWSSDVCSSDLLVKDRSTWSRRRPFRHGFFDGIAGVDPFDHLFGRGEGEFALTKTLPITDLVFFSVVGDCVSDAAILHQVAVPASVGFIDSRLILAEEFGRSFPVLALPARKSVFEDRLRRRAAQICESFAQEQTVLIFRPTALPSVKCCRKIGRAHV